MKNKVFLLFTLLVFSYGAQALDLKDIAEGEHLIYQESKGPSYRKKVLDHANRYFDEFTSFNQVVDDVLNHEAEELCEPNSKYYKLDSAYAIELDEGDYSYEFTSIKEKENSRSVAYIVERVVHFQVEFSFYKTKKDYRSNRLQTETVHCPIRYENGLYYKNTRDKSVEFLGSDSDIEDIIRARSKKSYTCKVYEDTAYAGPGEFSLDVDVKKQNYVVNGRDRAGIDEDYKPKNKKSSFKRLDGFFRTLGDGEDGFVVNLLINKYIREGAEWGQVIYRAKGPEGFYSEKYKCVQK